MNEPLNEPVPESSQPELRPLSHRIPHALIETLVGFLLGIGLFLASTTLFCEGTYNCDDYGGIVFFIAGCIIALIASFAFFLLCRRFRFRLRERKRLDVIASLITIVAWAVWLIRNSTLSVF
jgi:hypothetical membrane protein